MKWTIAGVLWFGWNLLVSAVAMNLGVTWAFHSPTVSTQERLLAVGGAWQSNRIYAALVALGLIALFSFKDWYADLSWRQIQYKGFRTFLQHQLLACAVLTSLLLVGRLRWVGISSMTEEGAITPVLWFLNLLEIFALFSSIFLVTREYLFYFFGPKIRPEIKGLLTAALETAIILLWFEPSTKEALVFFLLSFASRDIYSALFGFGLTLATGLAVFGLQFFGIELSSLIRLEPLNNTGLDLFNHCGFVLGSLVWAIRMWYPEFNERINTRIKRLGFNRPGGTSS